MTVFRSPARMVPPVARELYPLGPHCLIRQFRHTDFADAMSPLVLVDHFVMTGPTFELHPHAGMPAVTVLFEDSRGAMSSRDSAHNDHLIKPGDLHWTLAGRGIVHTQRPEGSGARLNGLQLFINLQAKLKSVAPQTLLLRAADVPAIEKAGLRLRVLAGDLAGRCSPLMLPQPVLIVDGSLSANAGTSLPLPEGWNMWIYARRGRLSVSVKDTAEAGMLAPGEATAIATGDGSSVAMQAMDRASAFVVIAGRPIREPVVQAGPVVMNSLQEVRQAFADYQSGKFGSVRPFV